MQLPHAASRSLLPSKYLPKKQSWAQGTLEPSDPKPEGTLEPSSPKSKMVEVFEDHQTYPKDPLAEEQNTLKMIGVTDSTTEDTAGQ